MSLSEINALNERFDQIRDTLEVMLDTLGLDAERFARLERRIAAMEAGKSRIAHPRDLAAFASLEERIGILEAKKPAKG